MSLPTDPIQPTDAITPIVAADDPRVDDYRRLNDQPARNAMEGDEFFMAEGYVPIERLVESGHQLRSVLLGPTRVKRFAGFLDRPELHGVPVFVAEQGVMEEIVGFNLHRGVLASAYRKPMPSVDDLARTCRRLVVLEALNDNENVGAISRAARAFGFDGIVLSPNCTDPYYRRTIRVSMGEILRMRVARAEDGDWPGALDRLHASGFETWAMTPSADAVGLWQVPIPERLAVVLGAEGPGLDHRTMQKASRRVSIPMLTDVDSLNVGHAAAITCAAVSRPRS